MEAADRIRARAELKARFQKAAVLRPGVVAVADQRSEQERYREIEDALDSGGAVDPGSSATGPNPLRG